MSLHERRIQRLQNADGSYTDKGKKKNYKQLRNIVGNFNRFSPYAEQYNNTYKRTDVAKSILSSDYAKKYNLNLKTLDENDYQNALLDAYDRYETKARNDAYKWFNSNDAKQLREWFDNDFDEYWASDSSYYFYYKYLDKDKRLLNVKNASDRAYNDNKQILKQIVNKYYGLTDDPNSQRMAETYVEYLLNNP